MADKIYKQWQVMTGKHSFDGGENKPLRTYRPGDKFITDANIAVFNTDPDKPKYKDLGEVSETEYLNWVAKQGAENTGDGSTKVPPSKEQLEAKDGLDEMTVADLKEVASDEDINIHGLTRKDDILSAIRTSRANAPSDE